MTKSREELALIAARWAAADQAWAEKQARLSASEKLRQILHNPQYTTCTD